MLRLLHVVIFLWTFITFTTGKHLVVYKAGNTLAKRKSLMQLISRFATDTTGPNDQNTTTAERIAEVSVHSIGNLQWSVGDFEDTELQELSAHSEIAYIEPDVQVTAYDVQFKPPSWGLDRIDQRKGTDGKYHYPKSAGEGVTIYSIDTGVNINHEEFEGRATNGPVFNGDENPDDLNGHGTFVAAVAVGRNFGVAKKARLVSLKALDNDGYGVLSNVLDAIDWIVQEHKKNPGRKSVVNLSLGAVHAQIANDAVEEAIKLGIHFAIAAGNAKDDACNYSPASANSALVVGATTDKDEIASFSNFGPCVSIYAPGVNIKSAWKGDNFSTYTRSGTSMASPHVAGAIALLLSERNLDPYAMKQLIKNQTTQSRIKGNGLQSLADVSGTDSLSLLYIDPIVTGEVDISGSDNVRPVLWKLTILALVLYYC